MGRRVPAFAVFAASLLLSPATTAAAQANRGWYYSVTPYFWMADLDGRIGVDNVPANVDLGARTVLNNLRFGGAIYGEARVKSYVMGLDAIYRSLSDASTFAFFGNTGFVRLRTTQTILQPTVGYTVGGDTWSLDFLGGIRYWNLGANLDVDPLVSIRPSNERGDSRSWVDGTAGLRLNLMPADFLRLTAGGDGGGGGAHSTWQAYGTLGLDVASWCTLNVAYRGLSVDYDHRHFLYDTNMQGVSLAAMFRFFGR